MLLTPNGDVNHLQYDSYHRIVILFLWHNLLNTCTVMVDVYKTNSVQHYSFDLNCQYIEHFDLQHFQLFSKIPWIEVKKKNEEHLTFVQYVQLLFLFHLNSTRQSQFLIISHIPTSRKYVSYSCNMDFKPRLYFVLFRSISNNVIIPCGQKHQIYSHIKLTLVLGLQLFQLQGIIRRRRNLKT